ncbi:MAG: response regulator [Fluviicola sp.]|nr:response regulator [Fluviicola sp.]
MALKILIVEDEVLIAEDMSADLEDLGYIVVDIAISDTECLIAFEKFNPEIILMDINIKGNLDGIELTKKIKENHSVAIIYITSNTDTLTMNRAIESKPQAFLSKPYNKKELGVAIELAFVNHNDNSLQSSASSKLNSSIFVKNGEYYTKIELDSIFYIEAAGSYCTVFAENGEFILSNNLSHFENKVARSSFIRIHRSYVVNIEKVTGFDSNSILINQKELPISKSHRVEVLKQFVKV